jgi:predicted Zn-ribbon and HTH transcriptional regulator
MAITKIDLEYDKMANLISRQNKIREMERHKCFKCDYIGCFGEFVNDQNYNEQCPQCKYTIKVIPTG